VVTAPGGTHVIVGGGSDAGVVRQISDTLPWYTHTVDALLLPQLDTTHITGAVDVLSAYTPHIVVTHGMGSGPQWGVLQEYLRNHASTIQQSHSTQSVVLGNTITIQTLYPDHADIQTPCASVRIQTSNHSIILLCTTDQLITQYVLAREYKHPADIVVVPSSMIEQKEFEAVLHILKPVYVVATHVCKQPLATSTIAQLDRYKTKTLDVCRVPSVVVE
jgi:beta-lactamase superfamily II metal-dependent hydrolase